MDWRYAIRCQWCFPFVARASRWLGPHFDGNVLWVLAWCMIVYPISTMAQIRFEEVTAGSGMHYRGPGWGAAWGDVNGDGWPDLYTTNHARAPSLYINQEGVSFVEVASSVVSDPSGDTHGAGWVDFDNDGDADLLELAGAGSGSNHMFINVDGLLIDKAELLNLSYSSGRGRSPLWYDYNRDGLLDVLMLNEKSQIAPVALFRNETAGFSEVTSEVGIDLNAATFGHFITLNGDMRLALMLGGVGDFPSRVYDLSLLPFTDIKGGLGMSETGFVTDVAVADFNGDLLADIFLVRGINQTSDLVQPSETRLEAILAGGGNGVSFRSNGPVTFDYFAGPISDVSDIFIGAEGVHPNTRRFSLSAEDPAVHGLKPNTPGGAPGVYVGYQLDTAEWVLQMYTGSAKLSVLIESAASITDVNSIGFTPFVPTLDNQYLENIGGGFSEKASYLKEPRAQTNCHSVAAGDFDNDGDVDLYLECSGILQNAPNILYENTGDGVFAEVPDAGGAQGNIEGQGAVVAVADYDMDGFLDIFVVNGRGAMHAEFHDADDQLFHNLGNSNHWIEIDLEGTISNRDGYGSFVEVSAGGVLQQRFQDGGMHGYAQNFKRLHFGLGRNTIVDELIVVWPSGLTQTLKDVAVDQVLQIVEGEANMPPPEQIAPEPTSTPDSVKGGGGCSLSTGAGVDASWLLLLGAFYLLFLVQKGRVDARG